MMRWIVGSSLKFRALVVAIACGLMLLGVGQLRDMPVDVFPEFAPPRVEIQTPSLGLSAAEVESLVTVPLEQALNGVEGLDAIRSKSVPQLSSIVLIFKPGTDLLRARQLVSERLNEVTATLPTWASPPFMLQPLSSTSRVMKIGLSSQDRSLIDLSMISYWTIRNRLLRVPGVANVAIWGERIQMMQVQADPVRMKQHDVTLDEVMEVTSNALDSGLLRYSEGAVVGTGGDLETPTQRMPIQHVLPIVMPADLAQVPVAERDGKTIKLSDVATITEDHQPLIGDAVINGGPGLMLIVEKLPWGNTLEVTQGVEEAMKELAPGLTGIDVDTTIFRPATFVETAIGNLGRALALGCLLVVLVLALFLFEWRTALISLIAIPLSLTAATLLLNAFGFGINTMILAGLVIAVGVVVDDAIIDIENIVRRLRQTRRDGADTSLRTTARTVLDASLEVRGPIVYATLIIIASAVPVFFLEGLTGSFFRPLALAYMLAVLASMVVALTVTPALALILLRNAPLERRESPLVRWLQRGYTAALSRITKRPGRAYALVAIMVLAGVAVLPGLGQALLPSFKERDFLMHWVTEPGASHPEEVRITQQASKDLMAIPGVRNFGAHIGQALIADEVVGVNFGENWISVDPSADYDTTLKKIEDVVQSYPGLRRDVQTYLKERVREVLSGAGDAVVVRIYGEDLTTMKAQAEQVRDILGGIDGVVDEHISLQANVPQVQVEVDLAKAQALGVKPGDVRRAAATLMAGEEVGDIFRDGKAYDVNVWSTPETRQNVDAIKQLPIDVPGGGTVPLGEVASVKVAATPNQIEHDAASRKIDVGANVHGRDLGSVVNELETKMAEQVDFPRGYHAELLGEYAERQAAQKRLLLFAVLAVVAIFFLLQASYDSWRLALLSFLTLPSALVGGVLAAFLTGGLITLGSLVGFFTVLGIAARNGILLINHFQHLEREEGEPFGLSLVLRGAKERLSPILMTTLATGLALVPLVVLGDIPGHEIEHPMAVVILGGLVTSTLLNLFVLPALYLRFGKGKAGRAAATTAPDSPLPAGAPGRPAPATGTMASTAGIGLAAAAVGLAAAAAGVVRVAGGLAVAEHDRGFRSSGRVGGGVLTAFADLLPRDRNPRAESGVGDAVARWAAGALAWLSRYLTGCYGSARVA
ncbi:efflux RND transporter permease subunit [Catellatospora sp. KI3]|uniref:efflux RND transporter permease subunit n=1 Tax=Catellatospora sp. KI3 TaxID=3041620 RepID=UPI0024832519|nr:efflux RND transporter permease subunit [Catellatospora sp. KI3]MDI1464827.1 efflux RND transporter permease subunit [Catellatospora sp. KI3]